ncbi:hypothetical protein [Lactobacillus gallinarum]|uniref:hypothetical protein n=1 Tax=Lactobacillus gallinarum TaxID=52242 RepID=UPI0017489E2E|nr:hypothetical protein [Lactobacillus gallinarum]
MNSTEKIRLVKKISAIIAIIAWVITIIFMAVKIYGWMQDPHLPAIHDQFVAIIGFIPLVSGFHPGIWSFDIAVLATIVWLILRSFYGKENRSH